MKAPATAPMGPSTTAPDTAPSAASPARSWAFASNVMSEPAISVPTKKILMTSSLANDRGQMTRKIRRHQGRKKTSAPREKARDRFPGAGFRSCDAGNMSVICPTRQTFSDGARRRIDAGAGYRSLLHAITPRLFFVAPGDGIDAAEIADPLDQRGDRTRRDRQDILADRRSHAGCMLTRAENRSGPDRRITACSIYLTKLRYEVSASISSGPRWVATIGIGDPGVE